MGDCSSPISPEGPEPLQTRIGPLAWAWGRIVYYRRAIGDVMVTAGPQAFSVLCGLVSSILIARGLGPAGMGQYALTTSVAILVAQLSDLGIGMTAVRYASRAVAKGDQGAEYAVLRWSFRVRMALTLAVSAVAFAVADVVTGGLWHAPALAPYVRWALLLGIAYALASVPWVYFQAHQRFTISATIQLSQTLLSLGGIAALAVTHHWFLGAVVGVSIVVAWAGSLTFFGLVPRMTMFGPSPELPGAPAWRRWFRAPDVDDPEGQLEPVGSFAGYAVIGAAIVSVVSRMDVWIMGALLPQAQVGIYQVAGRFTVPLAVLLGAINTALWPRASAIGNRGDVVHLLRRTLKITGVASAASLAWALSGPLLASWLFGPAYVEATGIGRLLCLRFVIALVVSPLTVIGYSFGLARVYWRINLLQAVAVAATNLWLLPRIGPAGAGWAWIAHELVAAAAIAALLVRACRGETAGKAPQEASAP